MFTHRSVRLGLTGIVVLAAAALAPAAPALADPSGLVLETNTSTVSSFNKTLDADCPDGTVVTGGGGYLTSSPGAKGHVALYRLQPSADGRSFWAGMQEVDGYDEDWLLTAVAVCAPEPPGYEIVSSTGANEDQYVTTPSCGTGRSVIGMGGRINSGLGEVVLEDVVPSFDLKTVTVRGVAIPGATDDTWSVTAYAVCANTPAGLERISFSPPHGSESEALGVKSCPDGKALYGAGAAVGAGNGNVLLSGVNIAPIDIARGWANEISGGYGGNWSFTTYGICGS